MIQFNKKFLNKSNSLVFILLLLTISGAFYSEFFQAPLSEQSVTAYYQNPLDQHFLKSLTKISIKNRFGQFDMDLRNESWFLQNPRQVPASKQTIDKLVQSLQNIQVKKLFQLDPINISNFSLENPLAEIHLTSSRSPQEVVLNLGIINPIDNSAYISLSNQQVIFQTDTLIAPLESLSLSDFVDSHLFSMNIEDIKEITFYRGPKRQGQIQLSLIHENNQWKNKQGREFDNEKIVQFVTELLELRSLVILDKIEASVTPIFEDSLKNPQFHLEILTVQGANISAEISLPLKAIPDLKIEKATVLLTKVSNKPYPFIIAKDKERIFSLKESQLRQ